MFNGFTPATIDFLWGIRFNNNRDWFQQHKSEYQRDLYEPMLALAQAVREQFSIEGTILKTSRIYRDVRYSGGIPYKEHLWFCIRQDNVFWSEHPSLYFQIEPEGGSCGFIHYAPKAALMNLYRKKLMDKPDDFLKLTERLERDGRFQDMSARYKRPKPGGTPELDHWYQLIIGREAISKRIAPFPSARCRAVGLCGISSRFQLLSPSLRQVPHALLTRSPLARESKLSLARSTCMC